MSASLRRSRLKLWPAAASSGQHGVDAVAVGSLEIVWHHAVEIAGGRAIWSAILWYLRIGPASSFGKKKTKRAVFGKRRGRLCGALIDAAILAF